MTFSDSHPLTWAELHRLCELGNRELATQQVTDRRWVIENGHLTLERKGG